MLPPRESHHGDQSTRPVTTCHHRYLSPMWIPGDHIFSYAPPHLYSGPHPYHRRDHAAETYRADRPEMGISVDVLECEGEAGRSL